MPGSERGYTVCSAIVGVFTGLYTYISLDLSHDNDVIIFRDFLEERFYKKKCLCILNWIVMRKNVVIYAQLQCIWNICFIIYNHCLYVIPNFPNVSDNNKFNSVQYFSLTLNSWVASFKRIFYPNPIVRKNIKLFYLLHKHSLFIIRIKQAGLFCRSFFQCLWN